MFNLDFLEKGLGIASPPNFVYDFSRKMFLMLYSVNEGVYLTSSSYFSVKVKSGACYITGQWGRAQNKIKEI